MPSLTIGLPPGFAAVHQPTEVVCEAATIGDALRRLADERPQYGPRIFYGDRLLVVVMLNGRHVAPSEAQTTPLAEGDRIDLLLPVAGG